MFGAHGSGLSGQTHHLDAVFGVSGLDVHCAVRLPGSGALVNITISAFSNVVDRAAALGVDLPTALLILPSNFERASSRSDLAYNSSTTWLSEALSHARIPHTVVLPDQPAQRFAARRAEFLRSRLDGTAELPLICATPRFVLQSYEMFEFVVGQLFKAAQMAKGRRGDESIRVDLVIGPRDGRYVKVAYEGPTVAAQPVSLTIRKLLQQQRSA